MPTKSLVTLLREEGRRPIIVIAPISSLEISPDLMHRRLLCCNERTANRHGTERKRRRRRRKAFRRGVNCSEKKGYPCLMMNAFCRIEQNKRFYSQLLKSIGRHHNVCDLYPFRQLFPPAIGAVPRMGAFCRNNGQSHGLMSEGGPGGGDTTKAKRSHAGATVR